MFFLFCLVLKFELSVCLSHSWQVPPIWMCTELVEEFTSRWSTLEPLGPWSCSALSPAGWHGCWEQVRPWWSVRAATAWTCRQRWRCWVWSSRPDAPCPSTSPQPTVGLTPFPSMTHIPSCPHIQAFKALLFFSEGRPLQRPQRTSCKFSCRGWRSSCPPEPSELTTSTSSVRRACSTWTPHAPSCRLAKTWVSTLTSTETSFIPWTLPRYHPSPRHNPRNLSESEKIPWEIRSFWNNKK